MPQRISILVALDGADEGQRRARRSAETALGSHGEHRQDSRAVRQALPLPFTAFALRISRGEASTRLARKPAESLT